MSSAPYGPYQKRLFRRLQSLGVLDQVGLADEIEYVTGRKLDSSQVCHWAAGRQHCPMDVLVHLARLIDDGACHSGPELVFGPMLRELGYGLVQLDSSEASKADDVRLLMHRAQSEVLDVCQRVTAATDPSGPQGAELTPDEAADLKREADEAIRALEKLTTRLDPIISGSPVKVAS